MGLRRQGSLRVSSSVAEGVLTPAALHLRVSAEVERRSQWRERGGGLLGWLNGPKSHTWLALRSLDTKVT